jgi:hypothetical protein
MTVAVRGILAASAAAAVVGALAGVVVWTAPVRGSVRSYTELLSAANTQDVDAARRLCSARYVATHPLVASPEGGIVGLPRNIHKNFQAWREGPNVWLCPTNRVGPIYQFVHESGSWRFDGPVGILRGRGQVVRLPDGGGGLLLEEGTGRVD